MTIAPFGATIPYYFTGHEGPDSVCIDSDDNLYVAMYGQGRVLVFNKRGYPIGQILMPGRDEGKMLRSTHPQFIQEQTNCSFVPMTLRTTQKVVQ